MEIMSFKEKQHIQIAGNDAGQTLNFCLLPDPPLFSLPSTFKVLLGSYKLDTGTNNLGMYTVVSENNFIIIV